MLFEPSVLQRDNLEGIIKKWSLLCFTYVIFSANPMLKEEREKKRGRGEENTKE